MTIKNQNLLSFWMAVFFAFAFNLIVFGNVKAMSGSQTDIWKEDSEFRRTRVYERAQALAEKNITEADQAEIEGVFADLLAYTGLTEAGTTVRISRQFHVDLLRSLIEEQERLPEYIRTHGENPKALLRKAQNKAFIPLLLLRVQALWPVDPEVVALATSIQRLRETDQQTRRTYRNEADCYLSEGISPTENEYILPEGISSGRTTGQMLGAAVSRFVPALFGGDTLSRKSGAQFQDENGLCAFTVVPRDIPRVLGALENLLMAFTNLIKSTKSGRIGPKNLALTNIFASINEAEIFKGTGIDDIDRRKSSVLKRWGYFFLSAIGQYLAGNIQKYPEFIRGEELKKILEQEEEASRQRERVGGVGPSNMRMLRNDTGAAGAAEPADEYVFVDMPIGSPIVGAGVEGIEDRTARASEGDGLSLLPTPATDDIDRESMEAQAQLAAAISAEIDIFEQLSAEEEELNLRRMSLEGRLAEFLNELKNFEQSQDARTQLWNNTHQTLSSISKLDAEINEVLAQRQRGDREEVVAMPTFDERYYNNKLESYKETIEAAKESLRRIAEKEGHSLKEYLSPAGATDLELYRAKNARENIALTYMEGEITRIKDTIVMNDLGFATIAEAIHDTCEAFKVYLEDLKQEAGEGQEVGQDGDSLGESATAFLEHLQEIQAENKILKETLAAKDRELEEASVSLVLKQLQEASASPLEDIDQARDILPYDVMEQMILEALQQVEETLKVESESAQEPSASPVTSPEPEEVFKETYRKLSPVMESIRKELEAFFRRERVEVLQPLEESLGSIQKITSPFPKLNRVLRKEEASSEPQAESSPSPVSSIEGLMVVAKEDMERRVLEPMERILTRLPEATFALLHNAMVARFTYNLPIQAILGALSQSRMTAQEMPKTIENSLKRASSVGAQATGLVGTLAARVSAMQPAAVAAAFKTSSGEAPSKGYGELFMQVKDKLEEHQRRLTALPMKVSSEAVRQLKPMPTFYKDLYHQKRTRTARTFGRFEGLSAALVDVTV